MAINLKSFRPVGNYVLVNVQKMEPTSSLIQPIGFNKLGVHVRAVVVSKGTFVKDVRNRDVVLIPEKAGSEIIVKGVSYRLVRVNEIIATV